MFKKIYFKFELFKAFIAKNIVYLIIGLLFGSLVAYFRPMIDKIIQSTQNRIEIIGINQLYTPSKIPEYITSLISPGLTIATENGKFIPSPLVKQWSIDETNTIYTFKLNDNIFWHNGKKLSAYDINLSIPGTQFQAVDNLTLKVITETPFSGLFSLLERPILKRDLTGLGQYKVSGISYQDSYVKELQLKSLTKGTPSRTYKFYSNEKNLVSAYKMGQIDTIYQIDSPSDLDTWPKTDITPSLNYQRYSAIFINTEKIKDKKIRQALAYATPKTKNKKDRCLSPISPSSWVYNNSVKEYSQNVTRAKELFDQTSLPKINISLNDRRLLPLAEEIKSVWNQSLGVSATISIENQIDKKNYDVILAYADIPTDPDQYLFWHSTQSSNITNLNNSRLDKLLEEGRTTFDNQERKRIYLDFQKFLLEESPAIFLSYPTVYTINRIK